MSARSLLDAGEEIRIANGFDDGLLQASTLRNQAVHGAIGPLHEAVVTGGIGAEAAAQITQECFYHLEAPVLRVGAYTTPYPPSRLEDHYLPDLDRILDAVDRSFGY